MLEFGHTNGSKVDRGFNFIFMLTENDRTISEWRDVLSALEGTDLRHIGCKDVGIDASGLAALATAIHRLGATSYLELVGATREDCEIAADRAIAAGFKCLLGGVDPLALAERCRGRIAYYPFPGRVAGHPVALHGSVAEIARDCRTFDKSGCPGVDLLLYRSAQAPHAELLREVRLATSGTLIVAGSINSPDRISELKRAGVDAFTIGSAIFDGSIFPKAQSTRERVMDVLRVCA